MVVVSGTEDPMVRTYNWQVDSPSFAVVDAIARYEDIETPRMAEQLPALHNTVDTDALNDLLRNTAPLSVSFRFAGYCVRMMDDAVGICQTGVHKDVTPGDGHAVSDSHSFG